MRPLLPSGRPSPSPPTHPRLQQHSSQQRRHSAPRRVAVAAAGDDAPTPPPNPTPPPPADDELWIERELRARKRKRDAERKAAVEASRASGGGSAGASSGPLSGAAAFEQGYVRFLAAFFGLILVDGVVLATSGFLPESVDAFAERVLYPSFSPIIGAFLLCSSLYGLWKAGQGGTE